MVIFAVRDILHPQLLAGANIASATSGDNRKQRSRMDDRFGQPAVFTSSAVGSADPHKQPIGRFWRIAVRNEVTLSDFHTTSR